MTSDFQALKLSKTALRETTIGQAVNLISNDVNRFDISTYFSVYAFIGPIHCIIMAYVMWLEVGVSAFVGIATILLFIPMQGKFYLLYFFDIVHKGKVKSSSLAYNRCETRDKQP